MCLAVPAKVLEVMGEEARVEVSGNVTRISIILTPGLRRGDYVLLHAGYALEKIDVKEAEETLKLLEEVYESAAK